MNILLAGSGSGVGKAWGEELAVRGHSVWTQSRSEAPTYSLGHISVDLTDAMAVSTMRDWLHDVGPNWDAVIQCAGLLHLDHQNDSEPSSTVNQPTGRPERSITQIKSDWLQHTMSINLLPSIHLAQAVHPLVTRQRPLRWVSLSALVGSITENNIGGWHSYRMSKAALNMLIRNLHIEWQRRSPNTCVVALHPGTTDTPLSEPFQKNIAKDKLYSPETTAARLSDVLEGLTPEQSGRLLHWDGQVVPF